MFLKQKYYLLISLFGLIMCLPAISYAVGDRFFAAQFLSYQYSVQAQSMGVFGVALPQGKRVSVYNPAIPGNTISPVMSCYFGKYFWDDFVSSLGLVVSKPSDPYAVGLQLLQCYSPGIDRYNQNDTFLGSIDAVQRYFLISLRRKLGDKGSVGAAIGYIGENYDIYTYNAAVLNFGYSNAFSDQLMYGVVINNITGSKISSDNIASSMEVGATYFLPGGMVTFEYAYINSNVHKVNLGVELALTETFKLRAGSMDGVLRGGLGLESGQLTIDYCYKPHILGDLHLLSLSFLL